MARGAFMGLPWEIGRESYPADFGVDPEAEIRLDGSTAIQKFSAVESEIVRIAKGAGVIFADGTEHIVCGVVLEPTKEMNRPDTQGDVQSAAEVAAAAERWKKEFGVIGLQHRDDISDEVQVLQSWVTPVDVQIGGNTAVAGSWLLAVRVLNDDLWAACKRGEITGFSIGGTAVREPVA